MTVNLTVQRLLALQTKYTSAVNWGCCVVLSLTVTAMDHWFGMLFENTAIVSVKRLSGDVEPGDK